MYKTKIILTGLVFVGLLIIFCSLLTHLKKAPQVFILAFSILTLISFYPGRNSISTILFTLLLGTMIFVAYCALTNLVLDIVDPNRGWIEFEGQRRRVMDMSWIWGILVSGILTPLTLFIYHKYNFRNRIAEITLTSLFIISTTIIFIIYELV